VSKTALLHFQPISGGSSQNTLGAGPPSSEWGGAIISSRWKNWGAWTKSEGAEAPPRPGPRTATATTRYLTHLTLLHPNSSATYSNYVFTTPEIYASTAQTFDTDGIMLATQFIHLYSTIIILESQQHVVGKCQQIKQFCWKKTLRLPLPTRSSTHQTAHCFKCLPRSWKP